MRKECVAAVEAAALQIGKKITQAELRGIEDRVVEQMKQMAIKDRQGYAAKSRKDILAEAGKMAVDQFIHEAIKKRQRAELTVIRQAERQSAYGRMVANGLTNLEALQYFTFFKADGRGGVVSLESEMKGVAAYYKRNLAELWKLDNENSLMGVVTNKEGMLALVKESFGMDGGDPLAKRAWQALEKVRNSMIAHFNSVGGDISKLADYRNPQAQDPYRVLTAGREQFVADHIAWVDRNKYVNRDGSPMDDAQLTKFLTEAWVTLATDGRNKPPNEGGGASSVANRMKAHRQLHFKSPEAYIAAMEKYGAGSPFDQIMGSIDTMARDIALVEKFGPNAIYEFNKDLATAVEKDAKTATANVKLANKLNATFENISGQTTIADVKMARFFQTIRSMNVANKLGSMVFAQLADLGTAQATARAMNIPAAQLGEWIGKLTTDAERREAARTMGLGIESATQAIARFGDDASTTGFFGKAAQVVTTVQGAHAWTRVLRQAFGSAMSAHFGNLVSKYGKMSDLDARDQQILASKGVTEADFAIWKLAKLSDEGLLGASEIDAIPTASMLGVIQPQIDAINLQGKTLIDRLTAQNVKEEGWLAGRVKKFDEYKTRIQQMLDDFEATRETRKEAVYARALQRSGELQMRVEKAEADLEIASALNKERNAMRADKLMEDIKRGVEWYGRRRSEIGERLGAIRHSVKLQKAAVDRAYVRESEALIAKANDLFGPERVEEGLTVIGKVTKAAADFDAYQAKMLERIEKYADKKNGGPTIERAKKLLGQAEQEFQAVKQSADAAFASLKEKVVGDQAELTGLFDALQAKRERAEVEADIAGYLQTEKSLDKIQGFIDTLEFRVGQGADKMLSEGERLGYRKARAEAQMKAMADREAKYAKQAGKEVFTKATELEKRIDKRMAELDEFSKSVEERASSREQIMQEWQKTVGDKINAAAEAARREAAIKLTSMFVEETHMAVLQPTALQSFNFQRGQFMGEIGNMVFQFKSFPWAFFKQHFMERANFAASGVSPFAYRAKLLATTTILGGMSIMLGDLAQGKDPRQIWDDEDKTKAAKFAFAAMAKGGGLPIVSELLELLSGQVESPMNTAAKLAGPTMPTIVDIAKVGGYSGAWALSGFEDEKYKENLTKSMYSLSKDTLPGQNLWFARGVLHNILLNDLQETANPGYTERARERADANLGTQYWLGMGQETRLPNFGNITGQR